MFKFLRKTYLYILAVPMLLCGLGIASNQLVSIANEDTFPVRENIAYVLKDMDNAEVQQINVAAHEIDHNYPLMVDTHGHSLMSSKTHLNWLADNFDLGGDITSIGDHVMDLGAWMWIYAPFIWAAFVIRKLAVTA